MARWSSGARRIYVQSEHQCAAGAKRNSAGLITMSPEGDWLDIVSVTMNGNTGVRVLRHRPAVEPTNLADDVAAALRAVSPARVREARTAAVAPIDLADIADASRASTAVVVTAWLNDVRQDFAIDAKRLVELAGAGVPDRVIDMMVALAYPNAFAVPPSPTMGLLATNEPGGGSRAGFVNFGSLDSDCADSFSVFGFGACSPFGYSPFPLGHSSSPFGSMFYGYVPFGYSQFGYGPYGYLSSPYGSYGGYGAYGGGYGGGYGGWYAGEPSMIVVRPSDSGSHGQVVNGHGDSSGAGSTASSGDSGSSSSGSSSGSSGGSVGASSLGGGDGGRTAHPR